MGLQRATLATALLLIVAAAEVTDADKALIDDVKRFQADMEVVHSKASGKAALAQKSSMQHGFQHIWKKLRQDLGQCHRVAQATAKGHEGQLGTALLNEQQQPAPVEGLPSDQDAQELLNNLFGLSLGLAALQGMDEALNEGLPSGVGVLGSPMHTLQTAPKKHKLHVAATNYDEDDEVMWVGLNVKNAMTFCPRCVSMCWCGNGAFLNVGDWSYKISSIMHEGQSLCMGKCPMTQTLIQNLATSPVYTVQLEKLPNAPFRVQTTRVDVDLDPSDGVLSTTLNFVEGDLGVMVPGYISMSANVPPPLSVVIPGMSRRPVGCIDGVATSQEALSIRQKSKQYKPKVTQVMLRGTDQEKVFNLPDTPPDDTMCLVNEIDRLLRGGDAVIEMCR